MFSVQAAGSAPLDLPVAEEQREPSNGGHYSGCTTADTDRLQRRQQRRRQLSLRGHQRPGQRDLERGHPDRADLAESSTSSRAARAGRTTLSTPRREPGATVRPRARPRVHRRHRQPLLHDRHYRRHRHVQASPRGQRTYEVFTTNCTTSNSGNPLIHKVTHVGGSTNVSVCQNTTCTPNAFNVWYSLGTYTLNAGTQYTVTLNG